MSVLIDGETVPEPREPTVVFESPDDVRFGPSFATVDGQRVLMIKELPERRTEQTDIIVVQHWTEELKRRGPVD